MNRQSKKAALKAEHIQNLLDEYIPEVSVPLHHVNDYTLLIAVLLSAQCTDERVNLVTADLFQLADSPQLMIALGIDRVYNIIRPCGLAPQKSKNIIQLSEILIKDFEGQVPSSFDALERLPGVGHKTASVVMAQAFNVPAFPVDTHIHRLATRWGISDGSSVKKTESDLKQFFPEYTWNKLHLQIIFFGRQYCKARPHDAAACPICKVYGTIKT